MSEPFLGEIRIVSFNFAPRGYAQCNAQLLPINQNQALFALLGTTYGGNGQTTFGLPDFRGRVPIHFGSGFSLGQRAGEPVHTLTQQETPTHTHTARASAANANQPVGAGGVLAAANNVYQTPQSLTSLQPAEISNTGGSQPHENRMPFLALNFIIALQGIFPSPN